ncbi:MAG: ATP-binding protein [Stygiobacter sp.]|nr:MAG: hypothetical protein A2299_00395 [Stygiobacter sp. RIFOXYB2_FULL_37_11]OGV14804.1 MAG: hypothetical protein A2440_09900 [Stygiobacter sp. RIFOXYC2_FULL_38_25]OGV79297.1 MAG: hypothetical protein A2X65_02270 [Stygiobacter sp. GWF2_38_21]RJQ61060.1 MAG: ATP-binding protein [Stygiobacter sp.]
MKLERKNVLGNLFKYVLKDNGVVIGSPGVGKTYLIREKLIELLESKGINSLYLPIDQLGDGTEENLREELHYEGSFIEWIGKWSSLSNNNILIFDSFDSARDESKRERFLKLILSLIDEYLGVINVIVIVRLFDARKSSDLLNIFKKDNEEIIQNIYTGNFGCRHFLIPALDDIDIQEAQEQIDGLAEIYKNASPEFKDLLRIPFNLWLLEKIITSENSKINFSNIQSEVQLLGLFWRKKIIEKGSRETKEIFLKKCTSLMVQQKKISIDISEVYNSNIQAVWNELLSDEILKRVSLNEQKLTYSHNILFDYAVNVLLIEDDAKELEKFLLEDFSRPLFLRPSLVYFFTRLWYDENTVFWKIFWYLLSSNTSNVNLFARLIPTNVIINETKTVDAIKPLIEKLTEKDVLSIEAVKRVLQTFKVNKNKRFEIWSSILLNISILIEEPFLGEFATCSSDILEYGISNDDKCIISNCGYISRNLLCWVWKNRTIKKPWIDHIGSRYGVPMVAKTFYTKKDESSKLLFRVISLVKEENFPIDYFFMFADVIEKIWNNDTELAMAFYEIVFGTVVNDESPTNMGSPVLPLISNRRQDFHLCHYTLENKFNSFIKVDPIKSGYVAIKAANDFAINEHILPYMKTGVDLKSLKKKILYLDKECLFINDMSYIWSASKYEEEYNEELRMLNKFLRALPAIIESGQSLETIFNLFIKHAEVAYVWAKLLIISCEHPQLLFENLFEILKNTEILFSSETTYQAGEYIKSSSIFIKPEQIIQLEKIILEYNPSETYDNDMLRQRKAKLLSCLPHDSLSNDSKELIKSFKEQKKSLDNTPLVTISSGRSEEQEVDIWKDYGADMSKIPNQELKEINNPLIEFVSKWQNGNPDKNAIDILLPVLVKDFELLKNIKDADEPILDSVWSKVAESTKIILNSLSILTDNQYSSLKDMILHCSHEKSPKKYPNDEKEYNFPSWSPAPRTEAAIILPWLFAHKKELEILNAIINLVSDQVPSVRYLVVRNLWRISEDASITYWDLLDKLIMSETNLVVNSALLDSLSYTLHKDRENTTKRLLQIIPNGFTSKADSEYFTSSSTLLVRMIIQYEIDSASALLNIYLMKPIDNSKILEKVTFSALTAVDIKTLITDKKVFQNSVKLLRSLITSANSGLTELLKTSSETKPFDKEIFHNIYGVIHEVVTRIYYHAEIPDKEFKKQKEVIDDKFRNEYYKETLILLEDVLKVITQKEREILFAPTAHYFMAYLNGVLKYDPQNVLHMAYSVAYASKNYNYNIDSMAIREVTKLVEKVIADYRDQFQDENNLKDLVGLLDIFADTGWPEALDLVWRLDEIYK